MFYQNQNHQNQNVNVIYDQFNKVMVISVPVGKSFASRVQTAIYRKTSNKRPGVYSNNQQIPPGV